MEKLSINGICEALRQASGLLVNRAEKVAGRGRDPLGWEDSVKAADLIRDLASASGGLLHSERRDLSTYLQLTRDERLATLEHAKRQPETSGQLIAAYRILFYF